MNRLNKTEPAVFEYCRCSISERSVFSDFCMKMLTSWLSFVVSTVSLSLSHWYPGSGVVLNCIDS